MSHHDHRVPLRHMLDYACEAITMTASHERGDLDMDKKLRYALTHLVELVGEAANRVPLEIQAELPGVPWPKVISMRNRLIHGYDFLDYDVLWNTIKKDLPVLVGLLELALQKDINT